MAFAFCNISKVDNEQNTNEKTWFLDNLNPLQSKQKIGSDLIHTLVWRHGTAGNSQFRCDAILAAHMHFTAVIPGTSKAYGRGDEPGEFPWRTPGGALWVWHSPWVRWKSLSVAYKGSCCDWNLQCSFFRSNWGWSPTTRMERRNWIGRGGGEPSAEGATMEEKQIRWSVMVIAFGALGAPWILLVREREETPTIHIIGCRRRPNQFDWGSLILEEVDCWQPSKVLLIKAFEIGFVPTENAMPPPTTRLQTRQDLLREVFTEENKCSAIIAVQEMVSAYMSFLQCMDNRKEFFNTPSDAVFERYDMYFWAQEVDGICQPQPDQQSKPVWLGQFCHTGMVVFWLWRSPGRRHKAIPKILKIGCPSRKPNQFHWGSFVIDLGRRLSPWWPNQFHWGGVFHHGLWWPNQFDWGGF